MSKDIIFTTETDGLCRHTVVSDKYIHLFPNMLKIEINDRAPMLVDNDIDIKEHITKINGLDRELLSKEGYRAEELIKIIQPLINDGDCLVSHNVDFHVKVLKAFYFRQGVRFPEVSTKCLQTSLIDETKVLFDESDPDSGYKKPSVEHLRHHYNLPDKLTKFEVISAVYEVAGSLLHEEKRVKPASF